MAEDFPLTHSHVVLEVFMNAECAPGGILLVFGVWVRLALSALQLQPNRGSLSMSVCWNLQHGANALFALGELLLNSIPFTPYLLGYLGMYSSSYGIWAFTYFRITGKWLYPVSPNFTIVPCCSFHPEGTIFIFIFSRRTTFADKFTLM